MQGGKPSWQDERGAEWVEWLIVTLILTIAFFALFQAVGEYLTEFILHVRTWLGGFSQ